MVRPFHQPKNICLGLRLVDILATCPSQVKEAFITISFTGALFLRVVRPWTVHLCLTNAILPSWWGGPFLLIPVKLV